MVRVLGVAALAMVLWPGATVRAHDTNIVPLVVGSTADGGGALRLARAVDGPIAVAPSASAGGFVLYTAEDPSFENPEDGAGLFPLVDGTQVTVHVTAIGDTSGVKLRGKTLLAAGDSVVLGTMPSLHAHPEWQLTLPEGASDCQTVRLRLTAAGSAYADSEDLELRLTNDPTTCATAEPRCGDADGNGAVNLTDGVVVLRTVAGLGTACADPAPCDIDGNGAVGVSDGVNVLRAVAGLIPNLTCPGL
jgi:hypothetical protein